jgi:hypothetical protein
MSHWFKPLCSNLIPARGRITTSYNAQNSRANIYKSRSQAQGFGREASSTPKRMNESPVTHPKEIKESASRPSLEEFLFQIVVTAKDQYLRLTPLDLQGLD